MTRRLLASWLLTLPILPLLAAPAHASSITCYGSIVITTLGTEGMAISVPDGAIVQPTDPGTGTGFTLDSGSGATIKPLTPKPMVNDTAPTSSGGSGGSSGSTSGVSGPLVTAASPAPNGEVSVEGIPVIDPIVIFDPNTSPVDENPPKVPPPFEDPIELGEDLPFEPVLIEILGGGNGISETPEPATLTLLGLAGFGGWIRMRRRK